MEALQSYRNAFEAYLQTHPFDREPASLYEPANYIMRLGGKRLRPILVLLGYELFRADGAEDALPVAMAVEVFHNFSLVHDDIMDEAPLRRGRPTVHEKFGHHAGILSGDVMLVWAYQWLSRVKHSEQLPGLYHIFNRVAMEVCEGQQWDMDFEKQPRVSLPDYLRMIEGKTAALLSGSLEMGALVGGANARQLDQVRRFGRHMGLAFQLQDDLLDTFGETGKVGKKKGGDIVQNKKTYLILEALNRAEGPLKAELQHWMTTQPADEEAKVKRVIEILEELGIPEYGEKLKSHYVEIARTALEELDARQEAVETLAKLLHYVVGRDL